MGGEVAIAMEVQFPGQELFLGWNDAARPFLLDHVQYTHPNPPCFTLKTSHVTSFPILTDFME